MRKIFCVFIILFFIPCQIYAFKVVQLDQPKIRLVVPAGGSKSGRIEVKNNSPEPKEVKVVIEDWSYENTLDGSKNFFSAGTISRSCAPWINYAPSEFTVPPFGKEYVNYVVRVPEEAKGGYYAGLFFESLMGRPTEEKTDAMVVVPVTVSVGSLFYIEVQGTINRAAQLENLSLERKSKDKPLLINLDFKNTGNVDITAAGNFNLIDKQGVVYARGEFNQTYTLPGDTAKFSARWKESIPKGKYDLIITLNLGKALEELGMGRGPVVIKEAEIEVGDNGEVVRVGELK